jgi:hypothetical protein
MMGKYDGANYPGEVDWVDKWPNEASRSFAFAFAALRMVEVQGESSPRIFFSLRDGVGTTSTRSGRHAHDSIQQTHRCTDDMFAMSRLALIV